MRGGRILWLRGRGFRSMRELRAWVGYQRHSCVIADWRGLMEMDAVCLAFVHTS